MEVDAKVVEENVVENKLLQQVPKEADRTQKTLDGLSIPLTDAELFCRRRHDWI